VVDNKGFFVVSGILAMTVLAGDVKVDALHCNGTFSIKRNAVFGSAMKNCIALPMGAW